MLNKALILLGILFLTLVSCTDFDRKEQLKQIANMKQTVDSLQKNLEINRIESEAIEVEQLSFNLKELTENLQNSLKELAIINNNRFSIQLDSAMPNQVVSDPTKLSQILLNLINNALKFTKNGEVHVTTKVLQLEGDNINIEFKVANKPFWTEYNS